MQAIMQLIQDYNAVRYASYRTALKMQVIHRQLNMQHVQLELIAGVFERHRLSITENSVNLDPSEMEDVLFDIYFATRKEANFDFDIDHATKLAVHYILCTFDKQCTGSVAVFSVKVALILLSHGRLQEKYGYLYQQLANHNACLSKASLHTLLINICKIAEMLGESTAYGCHHIQSHIDSCFEKSQGCLGVTESEFATWIMQEPPLLVWITTFNRLKCAEHIIHNMKCSTCKITPIQGARYSCVKCSCYHQCQECFLLGKISHKHKLKHPVREYCTKASNREATKLIIELIRNKLRLCPSKTIMANVEESHLTATSNEIKHTDYSSLKSTMRRRILSDPQKELQSIIMHLEEENRQLQIELLDIQGTRAERLHRHRATIESQLQRLKVFKKYLFTDTSHGTRVSHMQSTPMLSPVFSRVAALPLEFELSPIIRQDILERHMTNATNKNEMLTLNNFDVSLEKDHTSDLACTRETLSNSKFDKTSNSTCIELSTWIGGSKQSDINIAKSGFSQWLDPADSKSKERKAMKIISENNIHNESPITAAHSPISILRDNTPSSLQRPDKHSQHSSLQNIQGDLNDILDRLQNMVANDCLLEESYVANDNCKLKRATTEMEDLLTDLIEGMESRKTKLTTVV